MYVITELCPIQHPIFPAGRFIWATARLNADLGSMFHKLAIVPGIGAILFINKVNSQIRIALKSSRMLHQLLFPSLYRPQHYPIICNFCCYTK